MANELTNEQIVKLRNLNDNLSIIEKEVVEKAKVEHKRMWAMQNDRKDWVEELELECVFQFYSKEGDPRYDDDDENLLAEWTESYKHAHKRGSCLADGNNHSFERSSMYCEYQCWLFHILCDVVKLEWRDILRIERVWVDIIVILQRAYDLEELAGIE